MDTTQLQEKMRLYLDPIGRTLIGEEVTERCDDKNFVVKNPVIIHVEPRDGNISIQFFPILFKEFLGEKDEGAIFTYNKDNISLMDKSVFDIKLYAQYGNMFAEQGTVSQPPPENNAVETIKLWDN